MADNEALTDGELEQMPQNELLRRWKAIRDKKSPAARRLLLWMSQETMRKYMAGE